MKLKRLDARGVAHHFLLALAVVGIITAFTFQAVAGHAQTMPDRDYGPTKTTSSTNIANPANCHSRATVKYPQRNSCVALAQSKIGLSGKDVDGIFGKGTRRAVKAYQRAHHLSPDGIVGKCTWSVILDGKMLKGCSTGKVSAQAAANPTPTSTKKPASTLCKYYDTKGILQTVVGPVANCSAYQYTHSYGICDLGALSGTARDIRVVTKSTCDNYVHSPKPVWYTFSAFKQKYPNA